MPLLRDQEAFKLYNSFQKTSIVSYMHRPAPFECAVSARLLSDKNGSFEGVLVLKVVSSLDGAAGERAGGQH
jgi:hypothetical protein